MKINNVSSVHVRIRRCCSQIELLTNMKLITNFDEDFEQIRFVSKLGYITIDYKNNTCFTLGIHLNDLEWQIVKDVMLYCNWLETGIRWNELLSKKGGK